MNECLVSVVIPIYNVESYLNRCVQSVTNQTYRNLEIILVDDGSLDCCPEMCDDWAKKDHRIKVVHKKNAGLGMARNTGIESATGKYALFVDSDDYIKENTIQTCVERAEKDEADLVSFGLYISDMEGEILKAVIPCPVCNMYEGESILTQLLPDVIGQNPDTRKPINVWLSACSHLFRLSVIKENDWRFVSERDIISEDTYSILRLFSYLNRVSILEEAFYYYCQNPSSLTHTYRSDRMAQINKLYIECINVCNEFGYSEEVKARLAYPYISNVIAALKMVSKAKMKYKNKKMAFSVILKDEMLSSVLKHLNLRNESLKRGILIFTIKHRIFWISELLISLKA